MGIRSTSSKTSGTRWGQITKKIGDFRGQIPEKTQISGWGRGQHFWGIWTPKLGVKNMHLGSTSDSWDPFGKAKLSQVQHIIK